ncbi:uncharacterized protein si:dkey-94l16.4 isoform X2 [Boleophthalmus pectinirostris]|uniref:uncharacterized protein si:dkey-94l16.4 isoform X2 n=1 Tax=Boleophthalmus pectinirostris TaxID=150288 RepID=UPI00242E1777|nr:uncharacterized protein si:dkey-94l16.4 isoform X2 [Boleophthalmus pectinirostris]
MEQPPGTADDLQTPQDLSTSSLPAVVNLTRRGGECAMIRTSSWYQTAEQGSTGSSYPDTAPCTVQSGGQILPDNAFSPTTVTLSYVSRSHVFSTQDSLSGTSSVYGVPTFSKYSLQPSCEPGETDMALNQPYLENMDGPSDLAAHTDHLQSLSLEQPELDVEANINQTSELSRTSQLDISEQHGVNNCERLQNGGDIWFSESLQDGSMSLPECPAALQESEGSSSLSKNMEHFRDNHSLQSSHTFTAEFHHSELASDCLKEHPKFFPGFSELVSKEVLEKSPKTYEESPAPLGEGNDSLEECQETENSLDSLQKDKENVLGEDSPEVVCLSLHQKAANTQLGEVISPSEDPVSPSATSLDEMDDVFILPPASSSQSGENSFLETTTDDLSSTQDTIQPGSEDSATSLLSNDINECSIGRGKSAFEPLINLTDDVCMADVLDGKLKTGKVLNGNSKALQKTVSERKLPVRSGRGMRLDAIVMNINSSRYNVSGCIRTGKKSPQTEEDKIMPRKSHRLSARNNKCDNKEEMPKVSPIKGLTKPSPEKCKNATSDSPRQSTKNPLQASPVKLKQKSLCDQTLPSKNCQEAVSRTDSDLDVTVGSVMLTPESSKSPTKSPGKTNNEASVKKARPRAKSKPAPERKRKKCNIGNASSMFSPKEPEIKLRYLNYKEGKRDSKSDRFSPFIRVQRKEQAPSLCIVVNYPEEVKTPRKANQQHGSSEYVPAAVPTTSCLQLGRVSMQADQQAALVCCLCGQSANSMDLGDLHGPYYSEGHQPLAKRSNAGPGLKEESSDSDSSSCSGTSVRRQQRRRRWGVRKGGVRRRSGLGWTHRIGTAPPWCRWVPASTGCTRTAGCGPPGCSWSGGGSMGWRRLSEQHTVRGVHRAGTGVRLWAVCSKAVPTSITTGVLCSQIVFWRRTTSP